MNKAEESAFPSSYDEIRFFGLTKREYFASLTLQSVITHNAHRLPVYVDDEYYRAAAKEAMKYVDALIAELEKK